MRPELEVFVDERGGGPVGRARARAVGGVVAFSDFPVGGGAVLGAVVR